MGLWDTIKGWFNIGGVTVRIKNLNSRVPRSGSRIDAKVVLTTKTDKQILKMKYLFMWRKTTGEGQERKTEDQVLGQTLADEAFELKAGVEKVLDFHIDYATPKRLQDMGGVLGAVGKIGAFAQHERDEYLVIAQASVKGSAFGASDQAPVQFVE